MVTMTKFTCKCIACGAKFEATEKQLEEAQELGCMTSPCCMFPATVEMVEVKEERQQQQRRR